MTEQTAEAGAPAESVFQVTHYVRPAGNTGSWSQDTSAEVHPDDAHDFIEHARQWAVEHGLRFTRRASDGPEASSDGDDQADTAAAASEPQSAAGDAAGAPA